jgi:hypothetical protein
MRSKITVATVLCCYADRFLFELGALSSSITPASRRSLHHSTLYRLLRVLRSASRDISHTTPLASGFWLSAFRVRKADSLIPWLGLPRKTLI